MNRIVILLCSFSCPAVASWFTRAHLQHLSASFMGNCLLHGNESTTARHASHSIPMYKDERITFLMNVDASFYPVTCGSCMLITLVKEMDQIYFNKQLNKQHRDTRDIQNSFLGMVIDLLPSSPDHWLLWNTYLPLSDSFFQSSYDIQYALHPCPWLYKEYHEFLVCSDQLCHDPFLFFNESAVFQDFYNPYYITIHPRNFKYPISSISMYYTSPEQQEVLPRVSFAQGFQLPSVLKRDLFYLTCIDEHNTIFQYLFHTDDFMHAKLHYHYHGGIVLKKYMLN